MNKLRTYLQLTLAVLLPAVAFIAINTAPTQALFDSSKQQACDGANLSDDTNTCDASTGSTPLQERVQAIINVLTAIIGIVAVIIIIISGLRFITANGDSNSISAARNGVIYAVVGLIIVALAQVIVRFVLTKV